MADLPTENIEGVELIHTGTFDASTGRVKITAGMLGEIVESYKRLKEKFHAPVKIGHGDDDNMVSKGMPACGWVENLRVKGKTLVGDLMAVPSKLADLIRSGAYRSRSVEIRPEFDGPDGKTYENVLTGVALLGGEIPAVKDLDDVVALYADAALSNILAFGDQGGDIIVQLGEFASSGSSRRYTDNEIETVLAKVASLEESISPVVFGQRGVRDLRALFRTFRSQLKGVLTSANIKAEGAGGNDDGLEFASIGPHDPDPPVIDDTGWDGARAVAELRAWASSDKSGDPDTIDFSKYRWGFATLDGEADSLTSYGFPHHEVIDGRLRTSRAGVIAAWTAAMGGRTGDKNNDAIKHLEQHRAQLGLDEDEDGGGEGGGSSSPAGAGGSRPGASPGTPGTGLSESEHDGIEAVEEIQMELNVLAEALGLEEDATEDDILAAISNLRGNDEPAEEEEEAMVAEATEAEGGEEVEASEAEDGGDELHDYEADPSGPSGGDAESEPEADDDDDDDEAEAESDDDDVEASEQPSESDLLLAELQSQVEQLKTERRETDVLDRVESAIDAGKFLPSQRESLIALASADAEAFDALVKTTTKQVVEMGERGSAIRNEDLEVSGTEMRVGRLIFNGKTDNEIRQTLSEGKAALNGRNLFNEEN